MMQAFTLAASDGADVQCYAWPVPTPPTTPKGTPKATVQIAHGMGEHAQRYDRLAVALNAAGYAVYANDHRGHGITGAHNLGYMGPDGWNRVIADAFELNRHVATAHSEIPTVLLGHSMGATLAQQYITRHGASIDVLALSGSGGFRNSPLGFLPRLLAKIEARRLGPDQASELMQKMLFGGANKPFDGPQATGFEWLSRDADEVQQYIDDPACGFVISAGSLSDMYTGVATMQDPLALRNIPSTLPIYIFSGSADPVHGEQRGLMRMVDAYRRAGIDRVDYKVYQEARHELFNETNRDEVTADLITWLDGALPPQAANHAV
jgi:alpha-beta hydrolase superfamily lysophospholipase